MGNRTGTRASTGRGVGAQVVRVDLESGTLWGRRGRPRPTYTHGCGRKSCGKKAGFCPERILARPETDDTKSRAGRRAVGLPAGLVELLRSHRREQDAERVRAAQLWRDSGYVFTSPAGEPIKPEHRLPPLEAATGPRWPP